VFLCIPSSSQSPDHDPHRTIYYLGYPLGRFAFLKHRQLARQVGVIITTGRIRRTLVNKINLLVDSPRSIEASRLAPVKRNQFSYAALPVASAHCAARRRLLRLHHVSGCLGTSHDSSRSSSPCSSSTTPPRAGSSLTTSPTPRVRVPWHVVRLVTRLVAPLVVDYSASHRLVVDYSASRRLVVNYFASAARPGASARRAARQTARRAARRRLLHLAPACRRLLRLCRASGCLGTSRGSSRGSSRRSSSTTPPHVGSSSTTSLTPRVRVPRHVAWLISPLVVDYSAKRNLIVDYFASAARPGASARHAARHAARRAARRRLLRLM
jgi:hypothetical protein